jgi:hypothetical protein
MAIVRGARPESGFYVLSNAISGDKRLSWPARGLLIFLLSKPDHWEVSVAALVNETADCVRGAGGHTKRDGVKAILAELMTAGYLARSNKPKHNADGSFAGYDYIVTDVPMKATEELLPSTDKPSPVQPSTVEPSTAEPSPPNPTQVNTDSKKELILSYDLTPCGDAGAPPTAPQKKCAAKKEPAASSASWEAYSDAYLKRYRVAPLRNAKINASLKSIVDQVGADNAPAVVTHYLTLGGFYEQAQHPVGLLLTDLQKVWNSLHKATAPMQYRKPVTTADFKGIDYRRGINADGTF